jgi:hypothetical protein
MTRNAFVRTTILCTGLAVSTGCARAQEPAAMRIAAPELTGIQEWINSKPLALKDLRGQVVVLHFWTFG